MRSARDWSTVLELDLYLRKDLCVDQFCNYYYVYGVDSKVFHDKNYGLILFHLRVHADIKFDYYGMAYIYYLLGLICIIIIGLLLS